MEMRGERNVKDYVPEEPRTVVVCIVTDCSYGLTEGCEKGNLDAAANALFEMGKKEAAKTSKKRAEDLCKACLKLNPNKGRNVTLPPVE